MVLVKGATDARIRRFGEARATMLRTGDVRFRQQYLRLFIDRIEAEDGELTIRGTPATLAGASANDNVLAASGGSRFCYEWRAVGDESGDV